MTPPARNAAPARDLAAPVWALAATVFWGLSPVYFKAVRHVPAPELVAHRVVWSVVVLACAIVALRSRRGAAAMPKTRATVAALAASSVLLALNWLTFIWAVAHEQLLAASLGYFIYPLVAVLLGVFVLGERLSRAESVALALAGGGVGWLWLARGEAPWIALALASSFALYALVRKTTAVGSIEGLAVETVLLAPFAVSYLVALAAAGQGTFGAVSVRDDLLLAASGLVTTLPLLCFAVAVRRLRLTAMGLLSYVAPTLQFLLAVLLYGEPFGGAQLVAFAFIWSGLAVFTADNVRRAGRRAAAPIAEIEAAG